MTSSVRLNDEGNVGKPSLPNKLVHAFRSYVPSFDWMEGPTLDATIIETLQVLKNNNRDAESISEQSVTSKAESILSSVSKKARNLWPSPNKDYYLTEDGHRTVTPSAISLMQGRVEQNSVQRHESHESSQEHKELSETKIQNKINRHEIAEKRRETVNQVNDRVANSKIPRCLNCKIRENKTNEIKKEHISHSTAERQRKDHSRHNYSAHLFNGASVLNEKGDSRTESTKKSRSRQNENPPSINKNSSTLRKDNEVPNTPSKPRKLKTLWGLARINIFDDASKTYEIFGPTMQQPTHVPEKVDSIFVLSRR